MSFNQKAHEWVPYEEVKKTLHNITDPEIKGFAAILFGTGARIGELSYNYVHKYGVFEKQEVNGKEIKVKVGEKVVVTNGIRRKDIDLNEQRIRIKLPNFKYKKVKEKFAYVTSKLELWLFLMIIDYIEDFNGEDYIFKKCKRNYQYRLKKNGWEYTTHSLRKSRANYLMFDVEMQPRAVADMLGHADLSQIMTYTKTPEKEFVEKMEKAAMKLQKEKE